MPFGFFIIRQFIKHIIDKTKEKNHSLTDNNKAYNNDPKIKKLMCENENFFNNLKYKFSFGYYKYNKRNEMIFYLIINNKKISFTVRLLEIFFNFVKKIKYIKNNLDNLYFMSNIFNDKLKLSIPLFEIPDDNNINLIMLDSLISKDEILNKIEIDNNIKLQDYINIINIVYKLNLIFIIQNDLCNNYLIGYKYKDNNLDKYYFFTEKQFINYVNFLENNNLDKDIDNIRIFFNLLNSDSKTYDLLQNYDELHGYNDVFKYENYKDKDEDEQYDILEKMINKEIDRSKLINLYIKYNSSDEIKNLLNLNKLKFNSKLINKYLKYKLKYLKLKIK